MDSIPPVAIERVLHLRKMESEEAGTGPRRCIAATLDVSGRQEGRK